MTDDIPDWAWKRVDDQLDWGTATSAQRCDQARTIAARLVAAHEEEPVDPLVADAKDMAEEYYRNCETAQALALRALRRGIEIGRAENE